MCQPPDGTLQKLQKLVREKVAPLKKNPAGVDPAEVACQILEELGAGSVLRDFPEVWASAHYNFQQLIRADLRRKPLALVPPTTSSEEGMIVQLGLPGFEELARCWPRLQRHYSRDHKNGRGQGYVPVQLMSYEDWVWNIRFLRASVSGLLAHIADLLAFGAAIHGWADPDVGYDEPMADIG